MPYNLLLRPITSRKAVPSIKDTLKKRVTSTYIYIYIFPSIFAVFSLYLFLVRPFNQFLLFVRLKVPRKYG